MPSIVVKDLRVRLSAHRLLRTVEILKGINFELNEGDRLALIGPNGAGKSTLLQVIAGILPPSSGSIAVDGQVSALFHLNIGQRRESSGRRNMIIRNLLSGYSYKEIKKRLPAMEAFADIGDAIYDPMETYSQGMAMRVVFAAATAFEPEILLMDEWLGVGDAAFRNKSDERMKQMADNSGIIVLATHNQRLSREKCNLGLYLHKGATRFFGDIDECWQIYLDDVKAMEEVKARGLEV